MQFFTGVWSQLSVSLCGLYVGQQGFESCVHNVPHCWTCSIAETVPLQDPNQKVGMFESSDIIKYLEETYAVWKATWNLQVRPFLL